MGIKTSRFRAEDDSVIKSALLFLQKPRFSSYYPHQVTYSHLNFSFRVSDAL